MRNRFTICTLAMALAACSAVGAQPGPQSPAGNAAPVTVENFIRAETDRYFGGVVKDGGFGKFFHHREPIAIDKQPVIRTNRDTLYSAAIFDLEAGPVTITLPNADKRFMSMQIINEDQYTPMVVYDAGPYTLTKEKIGTRYVLAAARTLVDPANPNDLDEVHRLQDAIKVEQKNTGRFEVPNWDQASQKRVRDALLVLGSTLPDSKRMFGTKEEVDPVRFLIGAAMAWGGNPETAAIYLNVTPSKNDGQTVYRLSVKDVPVDGFWSISLYNAKGYFEPNKYDAYTLNNLTAKKGTDGSFTIQFGGCDGKTPNCLPIMPGWNYIVRLYRPRKEILDGTWKFPASEPVGVQGSNSMLDGPWVLAKLNGKPVAGRDISLEFDATAGRASGSTGVNRWSGSYKLSGQSIEFGPLITTRRAGPPDAMQLEREFTKALDNATEIAGDAERLVLSEGDKELLVFERSQR